MRTLKSGQVPKNQAEAYASEDAEHWRAAEKKEMDSYAKYKIGTLVPLPRGRKAIGNVWKYKIKYAADGSVARYKARSCAQGFTQVKGVDYKETFSGVMRGESFRTILATAAVNDLDLMQADVEAAFLTGVIDEEIFMKQPRGWEDAEHPDFVYRLDKGVYGIKQATRGFRTKMRGVFAAGGYRLSDADHSVYIKPAGESGAPPKSVTGTWIDDSLSAGKKSDLKHVLKTMRGGGLVVKDMGEPAFMLGVEIRRDREAGTIHISQRRYILDMLEEFGMQDSNAVKTPLPANCALTKDMSPSTPEEVADMADVPYREAVGKLIHPANWTRPDIAYAVSQVSRYMKSPGREHWKAVKHIMRYLKGTAGLGIEYGGAGKASDAPHLVAYADASWGDDRDSRRSTSGYVFILNGGATSWKSKLQPTVALSSTEAEYASATEAAQEAVWEIRLIKDVTNVDVGTVTVFEDNNGCIALAHDDRFHGRAKHIDIKYHFVREIINSKQIKLEPCDTEDMTADIFTKALGAKKHQKFVEMLGMRF